MSDAERLPSLNDLLTASALASKAIMVDDTMCRLQWGSATVIVGVSGGAIVAIAPLFNQLPAGQEVGFYRRLLEHNASMGGTASFAIQRDGWVVLQSGRGLKGMDGHEFAVMVGGVGRFADDFDDRLFTEFYAPPPSTAASSEDDSTATA